MATNLRAGIQVHCNGIVKTHGISSCCNCIANIDSDDDDSDIPIALVD